MLEADPTNALQAKRAGFATIDCVVSPTGQVSDCKIVNQAPAGEGFGPAALKLSGFFTMKPKTQQGAPVGGTANIRLTFTPPN